MKFDTCVDKKLVQPAIISKEILEKELIAGDEFIGQAKKFMT